MQIKPQTMSIVVGSSACNARCPFCISHQTPENGVGLKADKINYKNWHQACTLAKDSGVTTILLTGKGEPTLFPDQITEVLQQLKPYNFPIIELQTNSIPIFEKKVTEEKLHLWHILGLRVIAISNVGIDSALNREIYLPYKKEYINLTENINYLHSLDFTVRLATVMIKGGIDNYDKLLELVNYSKTNNVEQLTVRPVTKIDQKTEVQVTINGKDQQVYDSINWVNNNCLGQGDILKIYEKVQEEGTLLRKLPHGAEVYDLFGQNLCMTNCLTRDPEIPEIRQLIYFPDGHIRYDWEKTGAIII